MGKSSVCVLDPVLPLRRNGMAMQDVPVPYLLGPDRVDAAARLKHVEMQQA